MTEKKSAADILTEVRKELSELRPLHEVDPHDFDSEAQYRAVAAYQSLMDMGGKSDSLWTIGRPLDPTVGDRRSGQLLEQPPVALNLSAAQVMANPGFEDNLSHFPWQCRSRNRLVYTNSGSAQAGVNYLAANDSPRTFSMPSIYQDVYVGFDGHYNIDFGLYVRCANPVPPDRRIILVVRQYTPQVVGNWTLRGETRPMPVTNEWQRFSLQVVSGGRYHRCEVYWADDYPQDLHFDSAFCYAQKQ